MIFKTSWRIKLPTKISNGTIIIDKVTVGAEIAQRMNAINLYSGHQNGLRYPGHSNTSSLLSWKDIETRGNMTFKLRCTCYKSAKK